MLRIILVAALLPSAVCENVFAATTACETESDLRAGVARDFPPGSPADVSVTEVIRNSNGTVFIDGLAAPERDFLAHALEHMARIGDYAGGRVLMVDMRFAPPRSGAVLSFVEVDASSCVRLLDRLKIVINPDGTVTTLLPKYPKRTS